MMVINYLKNLFSFKNDKSFLIDEIKINICSAIQCAETIFPDVIDLKSMISIAMVESSLNPKAKSKYSSAKGLFQFTNATWKSINKKYHKESSNIIGKNKFDVYNPFDNTFFAYLLIHDNSDSYHRIFHEKPKLREIYLMHFAGLGTAIKVKYAMNRDAGNNKTLAKEVFSEAQVRANSGIIYGSLNDTFLRLTDKVIRARESL